jgi:hypothetical protein
VPLLAGHDVSTVQQQSWAGLKNGDLLAAAERAGFTVLLTGDRSLPFQTNLTGRSIGVVVLHAASNALEDLAPLVPAVLKAIAEVRPSQVIRVEA